MKGKDIVIIGAGGFGREVQWLIERINTIQGEAWNLLGYVDDGLTIGTQIDDLPVLWNSDDLVNIKEELAVVCAIGASRTRKKVLDKITGNNYLTFPNLIDPSALSSKRNQLGKGNIVCAGNIFTVDICMGDFNIINLDCTIGHDVNIGSFVTLYPSVNVSGCVTVGDETELGTGSHLIQGVTVGAETVIGAGTVVIRDVPARCTAVGNPAKVIKSRE